MTDVEGVVTSRAQVTGMCKVLQGWAPQARIAVKMQARRD